MKVTGLHQQVFDSASTKELPYYVTASGQTVVNVRELFADDRVREKLKNIARMFPVEKKEPEATP